MEKKICNLLTFFLFAVSVSYAQESGRDGQLQRASTKEIKSYLEMVADYAVIYSGRIEEPYTSTPSNHPYLGSDGFLAGTLCYNGIIYSNIMLRYNIEREDFLVMHNQFRFGIELKKEKVDWVVLNGYKIVASRGIDWKGIPNSRFLILLHEDMYPIIKDSKASFRSRNSDKTVEYYFELENRYFVCVDGICHLVKNKKSILNLFPDKKGELDLYARRMRLDFKREPEAAYVEMVRYYESLNR